MSVGGEDALYQALNLKVSMASKKIPPTSFAHLPSTIKVLGSLNYGSQIKYSKNTKI
jgi:hypothetical protein